MSKAEIYTVKLHGSDKTYVLLAPTGSNQDKFLQDVRKVRYCNVVKRPIDDLEDLGLIQKAYEKIKGTF